MNVNQTESPRHVSRFRPRRHWRGAAFFFAVAVTWIGFRFLQDHLAVKQQKTTVDHLVESDYDVIDIPTPLEVILSRQADSNDHEQARVRLLGVRRPWQWANDSDDWDSGTRQAIADWIASQPVTVRLSRRQISDDGVLLAHVQRDGVLLSNHLVRQGWLAVDATIDPSDGAIRALYRAEDEARLAARGIWSGRALGMIDHPGT